MDWLDARPAAGCLVVPIALVVIPLVLSTPFAVATVFHDGLTSSGMSDGWSLLTTLLLVLGLGWTHRLAYQRGRVNATSHSEQPTP